MRPQAASVRDSHNGLLTSVCMQAAQELWGEQSFSGEPGAEMERVQELTEEDLVKVAGFNLSWLPGGAPPAFVEVKGPLSKRLTAGRFMNLQSAISSVAPGAHTAGSTASCPEPEQPTAEPGAGAMQRSTHHASSSTTPAEWRAPDPDMVVSSGVQEAKYSRSSPVERISDAADACSDEQRSSGAAGLRKAEEPGGPVAINSCTGSDGSAAHSGLHIQQSHSASDFAQQHAPVPASRQPESSTTAASALPDPHSSRLPSRQPGTFVQRHGQQTLSNAVWALSVFDAENLDDVDDAIAACCRMYCAVHPQDVYPQVRLLLQLVL
jgi:hypothetical protein